jgi:hypothetical protein
MGGKIKYYMNILGIEDIEDITHENIKKCYRKRALETHPDKNKECMSGEKFAEVGHAKEVLTEFLIAKTYGNHMEGIKEDENGIWDWVENLIKTKDKKEINEVFRKMVGSVAVKIFESVSDENMIHTYEMFVRYRDILCIDDKTLDEIRSKICSTTQAIILNPTLKDLFNDNVYIYGKGSDTINIPLWHNELYYDVNGGELIVKCVPLLDDDVWISGNNNIHKCIDIEIPVDSNGINWNDKLEILLGGKLFNINHSDLKLIKSQNIIFHEQGVAKIKINDMYNIQERSDVIIHVNLSFICIKDV